MKNARENNRGLEIQSICFIIYFLCFVIELDTFVLKA